ncbi:hypothetical protein RB195_013811 [Necator americanus]|uniref:Uncharacterized protein n=1 Tax=Necator americanus TaxID=51031 RepID=A0ABR1DXN8_NECAM
MILGCSKERPQQMTFISRIEGCAGRKSEDEPQDANYDRVLDLDESLLRTCLSEGEQDNPVVDNEAEKTNLEDKEAKAREHMQRSPTKDENVLGKEIPKKLLKELDDSERKNEKQKSKQETAETKVIEKKVEQPNAENEKEKEKEKKGSKESIGGKNSKDKETNKAVETSKSALAEKSNTGMQKALQLVVRQRSSRMKLFEEKRKARERALQARKAQQSQEFSKIRQRKSLSRKRASKCLSIRKMLSNKGKPKARSN